MKNLKPNKIYQDRQRKVFYYTSEEDNLIGTYITKEAAEEGLRLYIEELKKRKMEKLIPHSSIE